MRRVYLGGCIAALTFGLISMPGSALRSNASSSRAGASGIDVAGVIETVSHRLERSRSGSLVSADRQYRASFDESGFAIQLRGAGSLRLRTSRALVGRSRLRLAPGVPGVRGGTRRCDPSHPALLSASRPRNGQLEWDFILHRPPAQRGALVIEAIASAGSRPGTATRKALRWPVGAGRAVTLGELVVKDAQQHRLYRALPVLRGQTLALGVPARILRTAAYPLTVDPVVSPEYPVSSPFVGSVPGNPQGPGGCLRRDELPGRLVRRALGGLGDLYGARVTPAGTILDPQGFAIADTSRGEGKPAVAFNGVNYLVVWPDFGAGGAPSNLQAARVSPQARCSTPTGSRSRQARQSVRPVCGLRRYELPRGLDRRRRLWRRHLRGPGHAEGRRARPGWNPSLRRAGRERGSYDGLRRHELPGRLGELQAVRRRHLRGQSKPGRRRARSEGIPISTEPDSQARPLWRSTAPTTSSSGKTEKAKAPPTTFPEDASARTESSSIPKESRSRRQWTSSFTEPSLRRHELPRHLGRLSKRRA